MNAAGAEAVSSLFPEVVLGELSCPKLKGQGLCRQLSDMDGHILVSDTV